MILHVARSRSWGQVMIVGSLGRLRACMQDVLFLGCEDNEKAWPRLTTPKDLLPYKMRITHIRFRDRNHILAFRHTLLQERVSLTRILT